MENPTDDVNGAARFIMPARRSSPGTSVSDVSGAVPMESVLPELLTTKSVSVNKPLQFVINSELMKQKVYTL